MIKANHFKVPSSSFIHESTKIECNTFELGENCYIGKNNLITCESFIAGDYLYMTDFIEVGRGGCTGPDSQVIIGNNVGIFERCVLNPSDKITIGDNVGIGTECILWTHGAWLDITQGFPSDFGPVSIGSNVWFPARSIMMPNTKIGDNCVIGSTSLITRDIPSGSLAMGTPCKVIKENYYPRNIDYSNTLKEILNYWKTRIMPHKGVEAKSISIDFVKNKINLITDFGDSIFDVVNKTCSLPPNDSIAEDLRDFLRRRGIKIYNGKKFKSMSPKYINDLQSK